MSSYTAVPSGEDGATMARKASAALARSNSVSSMSLGGVSLASLVPSVSDSWLGTEAKFTWAKPSRLIRMERGTVRASSGFSTARSARRTRFARCVRAAARERAEPTPHTLPTHLLSCARAALPCSPPLFAQCCYRFTLLFLSVLIVFS